MAGALTGAPPLATVVLKGYKIIYFISFHKPLHPSIHQTGPHSCSGRTPGDLHTEHHQHEDFDMRKSSSNLVIRVTVPLTFITQESPLLAAATARKKGYPTFMCNPWRKIEDVYKNPEPDLFLILFKLNLIHSESQQLTCGCPCSASWGSPRRC